MTSEGQLRWALRRRRVLYLLTQGSL